MLFRRGKYRFALVFPFAGIAIKFPLVRFITTGRLLYYYARRGFRDIEESWGVPVSEGSKYYLFTGIMDNWREFRFYRNTRYPFLRPTYFSFLGLLNIQQVGKPVTLNEVDFFYQMVELIGDVGSEDIHHFGNMNNFCFENRRFQILDYGSLLTQKVISEIGVRIFENFDPRYRWAGQESREKGSS